jgi:hypothetical protein
MGKAEIKLKRLTPIARAPRDGTWILAYFPSIDLRFNIRWTFNEFESNAAWTFDDGYSAVAMFGEPSGWRLAVDA